MRTNILLTVALAICFLAATCSAVSIPSSIDGGALSSVSFLKLHEQVKARSKTHFVAHAKHNAAGNAVPQCLQVTVGDHQVKLSVADIHAALVAQTTALVASVHNLPAVAKAQASVKCAVKQTPLDVNQIVPAYAPATYAQSLKIAYSRAPETEAVDGFAANEDDYLTWNSYIYKIRATSNPPFYVKLVGGTKPCAEYDEEERVSLHRLRSIPESYIGMYTLADTLGVGITKHNLDLVFTQGAVVKGGVLGMMTFAQVISESRRNHVNGIVSLLAYDLMNAGQAYFTALNIFGAGADNAIGSAPAFKYLHPMSHAKTLAQVKIAGGTGHVPNLSGNEARGGQPGTNAYAREVQITADWLIHSHSASYAAVACGGIASSHGQVLAAKALVQQHVGARVNGNTAN